MPKRFKIDLEKNLENKTSLEKKVNKGEEKETGEGRGGKKRIEK